MIIRFSHLPPLLPLSFPPVFPFLLLYSTPEILLTRLKTSIPNEQDWTLLDALTEAAIKNHVQIFVLLYEEIPQALANNSKRAQEMLEAISTEHVHVLRHRSRFDRNVYWSHHEKIVVIDQTVAFVGGIDIALMRYDDHSHRLQDGAKGDQGLWKWNDYQNIRYVDFHDVQNNQKDVVHRACVPRQPWRDIACQLWGAAATDVGRHFVERWSHARRLKGGAQFYDVFPALELQAPDRQIIPLKETRKDGGSLSRSIGAASAKVVLEELKNQTPPSMALTPLKLSCVQVLRSVSRWSAGTRHESSIHSAYCNRIEHAEKFVYVENQFFASATVEGDATMGNRIASALLSRILRAVREKEIFRVVVVMPLFPGFAGEVENESGNSGPLLTVMHWQYRTICRGKKSMVEQIKAALQEMDGIGGTRQWSDFLCFYGLRTWTTMHQRSSSDSNNSRSSRIVTENVYVHSKALIVDDLACIIGSANINDRSMLGNRDSEMCVIMEDETKCFGKSMREASMKEFFGNDTDFSNWVDSVVWKDMQARACHNTQIYREVLLPLPDDTITTWAQLKQLRSDRKFDTSKYSPDQMIAPINDQIAVTKMNKIQGIIVQWPLEFLKDETLEGGSLTMGSLAPSIFN